MNLVIKNIKGYFFLGFGKIWLNNQFLLQYFEKMCVKIKKKSFFIKKKAQ